MDSYWPLCARRLEGEMTMTDYTKLVEALQAEVDKANKTADAYRAMYNRLPRGQFLLTHSIRECLEKATLRI